MPVATVKSMHNHYITTGCEFASAVASRKQQYRWTQDMMAICLGPIFSK